MASSQDRTVSSRYHLGERLGSGGMGTVWAARDEVLRREVALKEVLPPDGLSSAERSVLVERTRREARAAAAVASPSVLTIYDVLDEGERTWIVMERLPRRTLADVLAEDGPLPVPEAAAVGLAVLDALDAAHAAGVLHRDVKPGNIMWGPGGRIVLADFGIAQTTGEAALTEAGMILGSPAYLAPERARGGPAVAASDLWGLGALLFAALEGRAPFGGAGALGTLTSIVADDAPPSPSAGLLGPVVEQLLRKAPEQRMTSAQARPLLERAALAPAPPVVAGAGTGAGGAAGSGDDPGTTAASSPPWAVAAPATALEPVVRRRRRVLAAAGAGALTAGVLAVAAQLAPAPTQDVAGAGPAAVSPTGGSGTASPPAAAEPLPSASSSTTAAAPTTAAEAPTPTPEAVADVGADPSPPAPAPAVPEPVVPPERLPGQEAEAPQRRAPGSGRGAVPPGWGVDVPRWGS